MPTERFPREQLVADVAQRIRDTERAAAPSPRTTRPPPGGTDAEAAPPAAHGLIGTDAEGRVSFLNPAAAEATGWPADDAVGKPGRQVLRILAPEGAKDVFAAVLGDGAVYQVERARIRSRNGQESDVAITVAPIMRRGRPGGVVAVLGSPLAPDGAGTSQLAALAAVWAVLADAPAFEEGAERVLQAALTALEADRAALAVSEPAPLVVAVPREGASHRKHAPGAPVPAGVPVAGRDGVRSLVAAPVLAIGTLTVASGQRDHFGLGRVRLLESVAGALGVLWAQEQRKKAADASQSREKALREAVSVMSGTGPIADRAARLLQVAAGPASASFAGLAVAEPGPGRAGARLDWIATLEPEGLSAHDATGPSLADAALALDSPLVIRDVSKSTAWPIPALGGDARSAVALPVRADDETLGALLVVSKRADVFDEQLVDLLSAVAQAAGTALQYLRRDIFVSAAAHALRTPMTPILGYAELLIGRRVGDAKRGEWLAYVHDATTRSLKVVDDLLQMTHLLSRNLRVELEPLDLGPLLESTAASFRAGRAGGASDGPREIVLDIPRTLPPVMGDPTRVAQAAAALLSNALKFSPGGGEVRVGVRYEWGRRRVVASFADRGVGIAADDLERIFAPFQRAYDPATRDVPGGGLGLSIAKQLVELMHGSIWAESEQGHGSVFHVAFPTAEGARAAEGARGSAGARPQR